MRFDPQSNYIPREEDFAQVARTTPRRRRIRLRWIILPIWLCVPVVGGYFVLRHVTNSLSATSLIQPEHQELISQLQSISGEKPGQTAGLQKAMGVLESVTSSVRDTVEEATRSPSHSKSLLEYELGQRLAAVGRYRDALPHFVEAVRLDPGFAEAHYKLAIAHLQVGSTDDARAEQTRLEQIDPDLASLLGNLIR